MVLALQSLVIVTFRVFLHTCSCILTGRFLAVHLQAFGLFQLP